MSLLFKNHNESLSNTHIFKCKVQYIRKEIRTDEICIGRIKTKKKIKIVQKKGKQTSKDQMGERILTQNPIRNII